jgi:membrane fusion protein (multidrug efflux system)
MLQRAKNIEASRLSVVPGQAEGSAGEQGQQGGPQARAPEAPVQKQHEQSEPIAAAPESKKGGLGGALKANRKRILMGVAALLLAGAGYYGYDYVTAGRFMVSTDDAYVHADATTLAAKVPGYVAAIDAKDNSFVHAGDVIARIDDGDYRLAVDAARGKVATQQATVGRIAQQITAQQAAVAQANAQLASAQAVQTRTESELVRQKALAGKEFASVQTLEQAQSGRDQAIAGVQSARAAIASAIANVGVLEAQQQEAERQLQELKTAQAKAERDLSFTLIRAPVDGTIGNRAMQVGDFVQTGQRLASLVPLADVYIDANFKETQVATLKEGQPVAVSVDALPGREIAGEVASLSPASGSTFSLLPPDNATGNFTKIVQRIAVRIHVPADVAAQRLLRPGMSVVVDVNTKPSALASRETALKTAQQTR